jgi:hypothetical protein
VRGSRRIWRYSLKSTLLKRRTDMDIDGEV